MDFTPGERAVLSQIRVLYASSARADQQMKALTMQWTPTHYESYRKAYGSLIARQLIDDDGGQVFRITEAGLRAIGVAPRAQLQPAVHVAVPHPAAAPREAEAKQRGGLLRRAFGRLRGRA